MSDKLGQSVLSNREMELLTLALQCLKDPNGLQVSSRQTYSIPRAKLKTPSHAHYLSYHLYRPYAFHLCCSLSEVHIQMPQLTLILRSTTRNLQPLRASKPPILPIPLGSLSRRNSSVALLLVKQLLPMVLRPQHSIKQVS